MQHLKGFPPTAVLLLQPKGVNLLRDGEEVVVRLLAGGAVGGGGSAVLGARARPVGPAKDGVQVGGQEEIERPAAGRVNGLAVVLINGVEVRALLAIDQYGDEGGVEERRD